MSDINKDKEYQCGDVVWTACVHHKSVLQECPVCFGKLHVTIILGNDEHVSVPCEFCSIGLSSPTGHVKEYEYVAEARQATIECVFIEDKRAGREIRYTTTSGNFVSSNNVFDTEVEALLYAKEQQRRDAKDGLEQSLRQKVWGQTNRSYAWGVGYHRREAKSHREQVERHEQAVVICKERVRK